MDQFDINISAAILPGVIGKLVNFIINVYKNINASNKLEMQT